MGKLEQFHREMRELDAEWSKCPVAKRQRELREEREREARKAREAREQQRQAATISQEWWTAIDQRIVEHFLPSSGERGWATQAIGEALGAIKEQLRKEFRTKIDELCGELNAAKTQLQERLARLPMVKTWEPDAVHYIGDVVVRDGNVYQARRDTGTAPAADHPHWICLARSGRDGRDGSSLNARGLFDAYKTYARLDVIECHGASYLARHNNPGVPGIDDGWQLVSGPGHRGDTGAVGPSGRKGERGARGEDAPTIINWTLDHKRYTAIPTMSDGTAGAPLELRGLFERFLMETQSPALPSICKAPASNMPMTSLARSTLRSTEWAAGDACDFDHIGGRQRLKAVACPDRAIAAAMSFHAAGTSAKR